jgi:Transglutaminase-like superfamily
MTPKTTQRLYLREAAVMLFLARLAVRCVPPARIFAWAERPPRRVCRFATDDVRWTAWAIERVAGAARAQPACLPQALAALAMLRRRGISSRLCLGVAQAGGEALAHAWLEVGADTVVGGGDAGAFTRLAEFGGTC